MQLVILSAGRGTRMKDLTNEVCKPMIHIVNKPILYYKMEMLPDTVNEVIFVVGYLGYQIKEYFGSEYKGKNFVIKQHLIRQKIHEFESLSMSWEKECKNICILLKFISSYLKLP